MWDRINNFFLHDPWTGHKPNNTNCHSYVITEKLNLGVKFEFGSDVMNSQYGGWCEKECEFRTCSDSWWAARAGAETNAVANYTRFPSWNSLDIVGDRYQILMRFQGLGPPSTKMHADSCCHHEGRLLPSLDTTSSGFGFLHLKHLGRSDQFTKLKEESRKIDERSSSINLIKPFMKLICLLQTNSSQL